MVLVSIHPFAFRRLLLIAAVLFGLSAACFADCLFMARQYTARPIQGRQLRGSAVIAHTQGDIFSTGILPDSAVSPVAIAPRAVSSAVRLEVPFRLKFAVIEEPLGADLALADTLPMN